MSHLADMTADGFFQGVVDNDLGVVSENSCWMWSDGSAGPYKLVMCIDSLMSSSTDVVLLAEQVYSNCLELGFIQAKLYLSDDLLLLLYFAEGEDPNQVRMAIEDMYLQPFQTYEALTDDTALIWIAHSQAADSPAVPLESWLNGKASLDGQTAEIYQHFIMQH